MLFYLLIMILIAVLSINNNYKKIKTYTIILVLFSLMAFKSENIGNDTKSYIEFFYRLQNTNSLLDEFSRFEVGYQVYVKIIGLIFTDVQWLFIITAIICTGCLLYTIKKLSLNHLYSLFLFIGLRFFYFFMSGLRQSIAVSIILVAFTYFIDKKMKYFYLLVFLASFFHFSALIFLITPYLAKVKVNKNLIIKFLLVMLALFLCFDVLLKGVLSILPVYYSHYLDSKAAGVNNIGNFIGAVVPLLFITIAMGEKNRRIEHFNIYIIFLLASAAISLIATRASILDRFVQYYWIFSIFSITNIVYSIKDKYKRSTVYFIATVLVVIYNMTLLYLRPEWHHIVPYTFFFE